MGQPVRADAGGRERCRRMTIHDRYRGDYSYLGIDRGRDGKATRPVPKGTGLSLPDAS